eukprot:s33_g77.t1
MVYASHSQETLAKLVKIATRHYEASGTMKSFLSPYAKAKQHQGDDLEYHSVSSSSSTAAGSAQPDLP